MRILIVIDMQEEFPAATPELMEKILEYKRMNNLKTYFVLYPDLTEPEWRKIIEQERMFNMKDLSLKDKILYKFQNDATSVIVEQLLKDINPLIGDSDFKIDENLTLELCGVNTLSCVQQTCNGLYQLNSKFNIVINTDLCNDSRFVYLDKQQIHHTYKNDGILLNENNFS